MNNKLIFPLFFLLALFSATSGACQPIMRSLSDAEKIKTNQKKYIGQPLSKLIADLGLSIVEVIAIDRKNNNEPAGSFFFRFQERSVRDSIRKANGYPVGIVVYLKEPFDWDYRSRYKSKNFSWTEKDTKQYGHLTVERLRIFTGKKGD